MIKKKTKLTLTDLSQKVDKFTMELASFKVDTNQQFETLEEAINHLPTKEEYYKQEDEMMGMLKSIQEQLETTNHLYENTNKRVDIIDKKLGIDTLVTAF